MQSTKLLYRNLLHFYPVQGVQSQRRVMPKNVQTTIQLCSFHTLVSESKVLVAQSCVTLGNPMDCNPPGSSVYGFLQARTLEWVAIPLLQGIFLTQGPELRFPTLLSDSLSSEPPRKTLVLVRWSSMSFKLGFSLNQELPDVQTGFRKGRGTRDQIVNICGIT